MAQGTQISEIDAGSVMAAHEVLVGRWPSDLSRAEASARAEGCPKDAADAKEVAWAVAWLLQEAVRHDSAMKKSLAHLHNFALDKDFESLRKVLTRRLGESRHHARKTMPLQELTWSVGCERRLDWRPPPHKGTENAIQREVARTKWSNETITNLNKLEGEVVYAACRTLDKNRSRDLADRAWAAAYTTYWSAESKRRWSGNARVSTLILGVAKNLALSDRARHSPTSMDSEAEILAASYHTPDLSELSESIERDVQEIGTQRQREILGLLVERGLSQQHAARVLGVTEAAISQALTRLAERLEPLGYGTRTGRRRGK